MLAAISLDHDEGGDTIDNDHERDEGNWKVVEIAGKQGDDNSSAQNVQDVEEHSQDQVTVGGPLWNKDLDTQLILLIFVFLPMILFPLASK